MSFANSKSAKLCTSWLLFLSVTAAAWEIDFSRRQTEFSRVQNRDRLPATASSEQAASVLMQALQSVEPAQDIVILNTEKGFVPEMVSLRQNGNYRITVVNVNAKAKNVSFIMDAFSEHHNTFFGETKSFTVSPKVEGVFSYQSPETGAQGRLVVVPENSGARRPASK
ncbi:MAG: hypothetical protein N2578_07255 [Bdellovibrionaceae bacterium]|nr:hypothetical protein [Pseudobdellovibrionaceae bacterium]